MKNRSRKPPLTQYHLESYELDAAVAGAERLEKPLASIGKHFTVLATAAVIYDEHSFSLALGQPGGALRPMASVGELRGELS